MPLEPREVLHVESPRLSLQLFGRQILLVRPGVVIEDVEQCLDVQLREQSRGGEDRQWRLRIIRRRGVGIPWDVVLGLIRVFGLRCTRITTLKQLVYLVQVRHTVHGFLLYSLEGGNQI